MADAVSTCLAEAEASLDRAFRLVSEEIRAYPSPISGCDAQFNYLLAARRRIGATLAALREDVFVPTPRNPTRSAGIESR